MTRTVVHVSDSCQFGGTEQILLQLLAEGDRAAWRPILIHQDDPGATVLSARARAAGVRCIPMRLLHGRGGLAQVLSLVGQIRELRPHVLHAHLTDPLSCRFVLIASALARVPAVVATVQLFMDVAKVHARRLQHRVVSAGVDRYVAVSRYVASELCERLHVPVHKVRVIYNAIAAEKFCRAPDGRLRHELTGGSHGPIVLTVARLDGQKGHRYLLDAAASVPDATFLLAGAGSEQTSLEAQARALGIAARVRFLGQRTDIAELLAIADVFVLPSLYEGLPLAVLEAMAAGTPIVATAIGGTNEAVVEGVTGLLVPPGDSPALSTAIRRVLTDDDCAARLSAAGRARVASLFSPAAMIGGVQAVYEEILQPREQR